MVRLNIAVVTVSDTRTEADDRSGAYLAEALADAGHALHGKLIVKDDPVALRSAVAERLADERVQVVLTTGGTGFGARDNTVAALAPLLDVPIDGFGELFRALSYREIGSSTIQSRAFAGFSGKTIMFCLPGSPGACRTAWEGIIREQLDSRHKPCHFVDKLIGPGQAAIRER